MKCHVINSRIPPPLFFSPSHPALIFVCRAKRTSVCLPVQRMSAHPPFLKIGCAERGLKIDPPLITVSLKYLWATTTFKHYSLLVGFYNPHHIPVFVMEIPTIRLTYFEFIFVLFSTRTYSAHNPPPALRMKKASVYSWPSCSFFSSAILGAVVGLCSPARLLVYIQLLMYSSRGISSLISFSFICIFSSSTIWLAQIKQYYS